MILKLITFAFFATLIIHDICLQYELRNLRSRALKRSNNHLSPADSLLYAVFLNTGYYGNILIANCKYPHHARYLMNSLVKEGFAPRLISIKTRKGL